jgi:hypothetical protein
MRLVVVATLVGSSVSFAQPAAPPPPPPIAAEQPVQDGSSLQLRAGVGFARYSETGAGFKWSSELQPYVLVGAEAVFPSGRGHFVLQGQAGLGTNAHMSSTGSLDQENDFHQEIFEASPRYRHPLSPVVYMEVGYRFIYQRLHFTEIPTIGDANEDVMAHAVEGSFGWRRVEVDGSTRMAALTLGFNRGSAENDRVEGEDFSASGLSLNARVAKRWPSGFMLEGQYAYRKQNGSDEAVVNFNGMQVTAFWPKNTTWQLVAVIGFLL